MKLYKGNTKRVINSELSAENGAGFSGLTFAMNSELDKENVTLIKIPKHFIYDYLMKDGDYFIYLDKVKSKLDLLKLYSGIKAKYYVKDTNDMNTMYINMTNFLNDERIIGTSSWVSEGKVFVDEDSIQKLSTKDSVKALFKI